MLVLVMSESLSGAQGPVHPRQPLVSSLSDAQRELIAPLLLALVKEALGKGLAAELTEHLGYDKDEPTTQARQRQERDYVHDGGLGGGAL